MRSAAIAAAAVLLIVYGNAVNQVLHPALPGGSWTHVALGLALAATVVASARVLRLGRADLGLGPGGARASAIGGALGLAAAATVVALNAGLVRYEPVHRVDASTLLLHVLVFLPLGAVLAEELAFRGLLLGGLLHRGRVVAVVCSAGAFAAWHGSVVIMTIGETSFDQAPVLRLAGVVGAMAALAAGGAAFAALRLATQSLHAPFAAHWMFNAGVLLGLRATT